MKISIQARELVLALDDQSWKGPGYLDYHKKCEIAQAALDEHARRIIEEAGRALKEMP